MGAEILTCSTSIFCAFAYPAAAGEIFLRTIRSADREKWLQCLQNSIEVYKQNQMVVEVLKNKGLLNQAGYKLCVLGWGVGGWAGNAMASRRLA
eukprot:1159338-Pelagomonas_calceolata.AAC.6